MSELMQALDQLEQAVGRVEALDLEALNENAQAAQTLEELQQDLFGANVAPAQPANGNDRTPISAKDFEDKLNSVIGKMESLLQEG